MWLRTDTAATDPPHRHSAEETLHADTGTDRVRQRMAAQRGSKHTENTGVHTMVGTTHEEDMQVEKPRKVYLHGDKPVPTLRKTDTRIESGFGARLAHTDNKVRNKAVKDLVKWVRTLDPTFASETEMKRLWNGLYYCFWMSDKPLVQQGLAERLAAVQTLVGSAKKTPAEPQDDEMSTAQQGKVELTKEEEAAEKEAELEKIESYNVLVLRYHFAFWTKMAKEWYNIDRIRLNKYYMLTKRMQIYFLSFLNKRDWSVDLIREYAVTMVSLGFFHPSDKQRSLVRPESFPERKRRRKVFKRLDRQRLLRKRKRFGLDLETGVPEEQLEINKEHEAAIKALEKSLLNGSDGIDEEESDIETGDDNEEAKDTKDTKDENTTGNKKRKASEDDVSDDEDDDEDDEDEDEEEDMDSTIERLLTLENVEEFTRDLWLLAPGKAVANTIVPISIRRHLFESFENCLNESLQMSGKTIKDIPEDSFKILSAVYKFKYTEPESETEADAE